jgi:hypothetical protein
MAKQRKRGNTLQRWEIALIKSMLSKAGSSDQDILAYFTRPTRSINHRAISEIRTERKHKSIRAASDAELEEFLATWPDVDPQTGLSLRGDELLIKAREAMISAVHIFNGAGLTFRAELFIVTSIIAWTYLLHAWFRREGIRALRRAILPFARYRSGVGLGRDDFAKPLIFGMALPRGGRLAGSKAIINHCNGKHFTAATTAAKHCR